MVDNINISEFLGGLWIILYTPLELISALVKLVVPLSLFLAIVLALGGQGQQGIRVLSLGYGMITAMACNGFSVFFGTIGAVLGLLSKIVTQFAT